MLTRENLTRALAHGGTETPVRAAMNREFPTADSHEMLESALTAMRNSKSRSMPVVDDGALVGLLTLDHVGELLTIRSALRQAQQATRPEQRI
jgi:CBS domain-containing protein